MRWKVSASALLLLAAALELFFLVASAIDGAGRMPGRLFDGLFGAALWAFIPYIGAVYLARNQQAPSARQVIIIALLLRAPFYFIWPVLSDDLFRYVWDGRVQLAGFDPYVCPPNHEALVALRDNLWTYINHPELPTPYPYFAQILFFLGALLSPDDVWGVKLVLALFDLGAIFALMGALRSRGKAPGLALAYAWNPLIILEFAWSGHIDAAAVGLFVISMYALTSPGLSTRSRYWGGLAFGLSVLSKYVSILALPALWLLGGSEAKRGLRAAPLALLVALPYLFIAKDNSGSLGIYTRRWVFNDSVHALVYTGARAQIDQMIDSELLLPLRMARRMLDPQRIDEPGPARFATGADRTRFYVSRAVVGTLLLVVIVFAVRRRKDPWEASFLIFGGFLALFPTVHPWYATWGIPFLVFFEGLPMLAFSALVLLSYHVLGNDWREDRFYTWLEYTPVALLIFWGVLKRWLVARRGSSEGNAFLVGVSPDLSLTNAEGLGQKDGGSH
jgi:alpha-1,6-mannosyltransferase